MEELNCLGGLPTLALEHLVGLLDYKSRKACRLVSKRLKSCVDDIGHSVKIDTRNPGSTRFCRRVNITEAHIIQMKALDLRKNQMEKWKTAILSGPINRNWLANELQRNCTNLRVLIINGCCLTSQDFSQTQPIKPFPIFDHLTQLQLFLSREDYTQAMVQLHRDLRLMDASEKIGRKLDQRVGRNMTYFLQTVRSKVLKVIYAAAYSLNFEDKAKNRKIPFEHGPLFEFIQRHSTTLEEIHVPCLFHKEPSVEGNVYKIPSKLTSLSLTMPMILAYWKAILLNQKSLQNLFLHVGLDLKNNAEYTFYLIILKSTITNNAQTLVRIRLTFSKPLYFDMKMFKLCECLEYIAIETFADVTVLNLNQLPMTRLKTVLFLGFVTVGPDFDGVQLLENCQPECLRLNSVSREGPFGDPSHMLKVAKLALRSRKLNAFNVVVKSKVEMNRTEHQSSISPIELLDWLGKAAEEKQTNPNAPFHHILTIWDIHNLSDNARFQYMDLKGKEHLELEAAVNMNVLETSAGLWMLEPRGQPFNFPRNADSYTFWKDQKTGIIDIEPHYKPYSTRVNDISRVKVLIGDLAY